MTPPWRRMRRLGAAPPTTTTPISSAASAACAGSTATRPTCGSAPRAIAVVGVGGVGSWTAEALARSGVAALDADRSRPRRRVERQPPGAGARQHARHGQGRGAARAHRRHPPGLRRPCGRGVRRRGQLARRCCPSRSTRSSMPATRAAPRRRSPPGRWRRGVPLVTRRRRRRQAQPRAGRGRRPGDVDARPGARGAAPAAAQVPRRARKSGAIGIACVFSREPVVLPRGRERGLRRRRHAQLPRLRLERRRDRDLRPGGRDPCARIRRARSLTGRALPPPYNHGLGGLLAQLVEQRTFNP